MKHKLPPARDIPPERKTLYHAGQVAAILGLLLFLSTFFSFAAGFGRFDNFQQRTRSIMFRAISGMVLMIGGGAMQTIAARGLAGSGLLLDPQRARRDQEPWSRLQGGLAHDALDELLPGGLEKVASHLDPDADPNPNPDTASATEIVRLRCLHCRALNDEHARFCNQCGQPI